MGPAWGPKVDLGAHFEGKRGSGLFLGCPGDVILRPRVAQETPRVANSHQKSAQRGPREVPKERKVRKNRKLRHLDFERHYGGLATFTPFGDDRDTKKHKQMITENPTTHVHTQKLKKNTTRGLRFPQEWCLRTSFISHNAGRSETSFHLIIIYVFG